MIDDSGSARNGDSLAGFGFDDELWIERVREAETPVDLGVIARFELLEEVSRGGQGIVYRARERGSTRPLAVKRLIAGSFATASMRHRFEREVEAASTLSHPNIVRVVDMDVTNDQPMLVMEWIDGVPITAWARPAEGEPRSTTQIAAMFVKLCAAVHYAHQRGVIHRDLKPSNILVDARDEPHILDFGLAKQTTTGDRSVATVTLSGQYVGTPAYSSPEQVRGGAEATDVRSDEYSLGVVFFEMLTGQMPYCLDGTLAQTFDVIQRAEPVRPSSLNAGIGREIDAIVLKALAKDKASRYASVDALGKDVDRYLHGRPIEAKGDSALYVLGKILKRYRLPATVAALIVVAIVGAVVTMSVMYRRAEDEADKARRVQKFLQETLTSASPYEVGGDVTVLEMLDVAADRIDAELADHPEAEAGIRLTIGQVYTQFWMWDQAEPHLRRALSVYRRLHGREHEDVATTTTLLSRALTHQGNAGSVSLAREALTTRRTLYGNEHALVAESMTALAFAMWKRGGPLDVEEADELYRDALDVYRRVQDEPIDHWARALYSYGAYCGSYGRVDEADENYRAAADMWRSLSTGAHVYLVRCLEDYASLLRQSGRYDEAVAVLDESIARTPPGFGAERTPYQFWGLGQVQHARGALETAETMFRKSLLLKCQRLARQQPDDADRWHQLAFRLNSSSEGGGEAQPDLQVYLDVFLALRKHGGRGAIAVAQGLGDVAALRMSRGENDAVEPLLRECIKLWEGCVPADDTRLADPTSLLGVCLMRQGRFAEAEPLLEQSRTTYEKRLGAQHPFTTVARDRLDDLHRQWTGATDLPQPRQRDPVGELF